MSDRECGFMETRFPLGMDTTPKAAVVSRAFIILLSADIGPSRLFPALQARRASHE